MNRFTGLFRSIPQIFTRDIGRKSMALLLAIILYGNVTYKSKDIHARIVSGVNVRLRLPADVVNAQGSVIPVQLKISGSQRVLNRITPESFDCELDLADVKPDMPRSEEITPSKFRKPFGVTIEGVTPERISLQLDRVVTRRLPIRQVFDSEDRLPAGYIIKGVSVRPDEVEVKGPSAVVSTLQQVRTMPVPVDGTTREGFDFVAELQKLDGVTMSPEQVTMRVEIGRKALGERSLSGLPYSLLMTQGQRDTLIAEPAPGAPSGVEVVVRGPDERRGAMQKNWLRIFADLSDLQKPGEYVLPLSCVFVTPEARELEILRIAPEKLRVIVRPRTASALRK